MLPWYADQTIYVIHPALTTQRGTERRDYDTPTPVKVEGCILEPEDSFDSAGATIHGYHLMAPPGTDLDTADAVVYKGRRLQVDGDPLVIEQGLADTDYLDVHLKGWSYNA